MQESRSWGLYDGLHYAGPAAEPEPPRLLLKRLEPRLDHDAAMQALVSRLKNTTIPALDLHDDSAGAFFEHINELIRIHNAKDKASWIPPVALRVIPDDLDKPEPSPTDFSALKSERIGVSLSRGSLWDAIHQVTSLTELWIVPEPNVIWLDAPSFSIQELIKRSYVIPGFIFPDKKRAEATLRQLDLLPDASETWLSWSFDEKSHVLNLSLAGNSIDTFEVWYAHELLKHGYSISPWQPEGAIDSSSKDIPQSQRRDPEDLQRLSKDADSVMAMVCKPDAPGWNQAKVERLGRLIRSLCRIDQWLQRNPRVPDLAEAPPDPPEGLSQGANPAEVKDPAARKAYAEAGAKADLMGKLIDARINAQFLYKNELDYTFLFVTGYFDPSERDKVIYAIADNIKGQSLRDNARTDFQTIARQLDRRADERHVENGAKNLQKESRLGF